MPCSIWLEQTLISCMIEPENIIHAAVVTSLLNLSPHTGLFECHKLLFSFAMTVRIQEVESHLNRDELDFFIKGNISLEKSARQKPFDWLPDQGWEDIIKLMTVVPDVFGSLADDIERNERAWKEVRVHCACPSSILEPNA